MQEEQKLSSTKIKPEVLKAMEKHFMEEIEEFAEEYPNTIGRLYDSYQTLCEQNWPKDKLDGYLRAISDLIIIKKGQWADIDPKLPKYVSLNGIGLRLQGKKYWRDAGHWDVGYKLKENKLVSTSSMKQLSGIELKEITEKEWKESNKGYV